MANDISVSVPLDSDLKEQSERVLELFGLNMTAAVNMLLRQIVREKAIPLSFSLSSQAGVNEELLFAQAERRNGYIGRTADEVADDIGRIISEVENGAR